MGFAEEMTNLGESFLDSFDNRMSFMEENRSGVKKMKQNTHQFMNELKKDRKAMGRKLHTELHNFTDHLGEAVDKMLGGCKKHRHQIHLECKAGHNAFQRAAKEMADRRHCLFTRGKKGKKAEHASKE